MGKPRTGPNWTDLGLVQGRKVARVTRTISFCGARSACVEGYDHATHFIRYTLFFVGHGQPMLKGTTVPPILFGPQIQTETGLKIEKENPLDRGPDRRGPV